MICGLEPESFARWSSTAIRGDGACGRTVTRRRVAVIGWTDEQVRRRWTDDCECRFLAGESVHRLGRRAPEAWTTQREQQAHERIADVREAMLKLDALGIYASFQRFQPLLQGRHPSRGCLRSPARRRHWPPYPNWVSLNDWSHDCTTVRLTRDPPPHHQDAQPEGRHPAAEEDQHVTSKLLGGTVEHGLL